MAKNIISSYAAFSQAFTVPENDERTSALKRYFARGGVISAVKSSGPWPKLLYPSPMRIESQIKEMDELLQHFLAKEKEWKKKLANAKSYHSRHQILKFSEPLYWKHIAKTVADPDYREDAGKVSLPVHLSADPKWKPMINMFVNNTEYRKNLVETVETSIVYKKDKKVAKYADVLQNLRSEISATKLEEIDKKTTLLKSEINALKLIKKWAQEG